MAKLNVVSEIYVDELEYNYEDILNDVLQKNMEETQNCLFLSDLRENILNWYDFRLNAAILEIGSSFGEITGVLCRNAKKVVSVEISKDRSYINFQRNKDYDNLEILVGNIKEISFSNKFDYVIAHVNNDCYTYSDLIKIAKDNIKESGRLLLLAENRYALKYFSGAVSKNTKKHFDSIMDDDLNSGMIDKCRLDHILKDQGFAYYKYFYPYPDMYFPNEIFTDCTLKKMGYGRNRNIYEKDWVKLFDMGKAYNNLPEGMMSFFVNSFLVEASLNQILDEKNIEYVKISTDRNEVFRIGTMIYSTPKGERYVDKIPMHEKAFKHIQKLKQNNNIHSDSFYYLEDISNDNNFARYQFLTKDTLDFQLYKYAKSGNINKVKEILLMLKTALLHQKTSFNEESFENFCIVFSREEKVFNYDCIQPANVDLILDNMYIINDKICIIDGEWIFDFPVPISYILWRLVREWYEKHSDLEEYIKKEDIYQWFDIKIEDENIFYNWTIDFVYRYVGCDRLANIFEELIPIDLDLYANQYYLNRTMNAKLYYKCEDDFNEENVIITTCPFINDEFTVTFKLPDIVGIHGIRIDFVEEPCWCQIKSCVIDGKEVILSSNSNETIDQKDYFYTIDPWYIFFDEDLSNCEVHISGKLKLLTAKQYSQMSEAYYDKILKGKNMELIEKQGLVDEVSKDLESVYASKSWRYTAFLRK